MPDLLDGNGLQVKTLSELIEDCEDGYKEIYGDDINIDSNSPDGQQINLLAQMGVDIRELISNVYNSFNPDNALGVVLDQRVALNNIEREEGTYTIVPVDITCSQSTPLTGLDDQSEDAEPTGDIYTVQDDSGNEFYLIDSVTLPSGETTVNFRAKEIGNVEVTTETITTQTTVVLGVTSLTNTSSVSTQGTDQESDSTLKIRRTKSRANASFGYLNGLQGKLLAVDGVTDAKAYENKTDSVDSDGIPAHGVWAIVEGGTDANIAAVMESTLNPGVNMKGDESYTLDTPAGVGQVYLFDRPEDEDLYIQFDIQPTEDDATFSEPIKTAIKEYIVENKTYSIGEYAETSSLTATIKAALDSLSGEGVPVNVEISKNGSDWYDYLTTTTKDKKFTLSTVNISITVIT
jgi:uncharacterized phage protein gp47/JayE